MIELDHNFTQLMQRALALQKTPWHASRRHPTMLAPVARVAGPVTSSLLEAGGAERAASQA